MTKLFDQSKTILIGSIFYSRHSIVKDPERGIFDRDRAEDLINRQKELSDNYQIPSLLDVVAESGEAMVKYLEFVFSVSDDPIILDGFVEARISGLEFAMEHGLTGKIIYNSINTTNTKRELELLSKAKIKSAIVFDYDPSYTSPSKRLMLLTGDGKVEGLIEKAKRIGIEKILIDVVPTDIKSLGEVIETLLLVKNAYPYPAGCGPANVSYYMAEYLRKEIDTKVLVSSVDAVSQIFSDFLFYGPIERCEIAFESAYIVEEIKSGMSVPIHGLVVR